MACIGNPAEFPEAAPLIELKSVKSKAVCIARLEAVKGHVHLLAAWKRLRDRGHSYELDIVGEGSLRESLESQVRRDGTQGQIHFRGYTDNVAKFLDNSLFAILASKVEGQGIVTLEAAARGRASLLTAVPGSVDLLPPDRHLTNGIEFGDVDALASALEEWFANPETTANEGRCFFDFLRASSNPKQIALKYRAVYQEVLGSFNLLPSFGNQLPMVVDAETIKPID
jgi:glycosyltransferase involved in cell wall biosynthesis